MKKKLKTVTALVISLLIAFSVVSVSVNLDVYAATDKSTIGEDKQELKELQRKLALIKQQKESAKNAQSSSGKDYQNILEQKIALEKDISFLVDEINSINQIVDVYDDIINSIKVEMFEQTEKINKLYTIYDKIVVYYYEYGSPSTFELFAESESIASYLVKKDYVASVLDYMNSILAEIESVSIDLENNMDVYQSSLNDLSAQKNRLDEAMLEFQNEEKELENLMQQIDGDIQLTAGQITQFEKNQSELEKQISALSKTIQLKIDYLDPDYGWFLDCAYWSKCEVVSGFNLQNSKNGIEVSVPYGTPVQSVKAGVVTKSFYSDSGLGNCIVITHNDGTSTVYGHLSKRMVEENDIVLFGQIIGKAGSTGNASGNRVYFGMYIEDEYVNPAKYLSDDIKKALDKKGLLK